MNWLLTTLHTNSRTQHNHNGHIRDAADTLHSPLGNLLSAYKTVPILLKPYFFFVLFSLVFYFYLFSTHTIYFAFVVSAAIQRPKKKRKKNESSPKTGWHESSFSEWKRKKNKFICHSSWSIISSSWFHINGIIVPFLVPYLVRSISAQHIFPFAHTFAPWKVLFIFFGCRRIVLLLSPPHRFYIYCIS